MMFSRHESDDRLFAYIEGQLPLHQAERVAGHLAVCDRCSHQARRYKVWMASFATSLPMTPENFLSPVLDRRECGVKNAYRRSPMGHDGARAALVSSVRDASRSRIPFSLNPFYFSRGTTGLALAIVTGAIAGFWVTQPKVPVKRTSSQRSSPFKIQVNDLPSIKSMDGAQRMRELHRSLVKYLREHRDTFPPMSDLIVLETRPNSGRKSPDAPNNGSITVYPPSGKKTAIREKRYPAKFEVNTLIRTNPQLSGKRLEEVLRSSSKEDTVVYYESAPAKDGTRGVIYLDGQVRRLTESEWNNLKVESGL